MESMRHEISMPYWYRIVILVLIIYMLVLTGWVWYLAMIMHDRSLLVNLNDYESFKRLMLVFHGTLFAISIIGWSMQTIWLKDETLALFPLTILLGALLLNVLVVEMHMVASIYV